MRGVLMMCVSTVAFSVLSIVILQEQLHLRRWAAIGLGFAGMLIILRPGLVIVETGAWCQKRSNVRQVKKTINAAQGIIIRHKLFNRDLVNKPPCTTCLGPIITAPPLSKRVNQRQAIR
jgi:hypothetical protein